MAARSVREQAPNEYEQRRLDRIANNQAKLDSIGALRQKTLLEGSFQAVRRPATPTRQPKVKGLTPASRQSQRLQKAPPENAGLKEFADEVNADTGKSVLPASGLSDEAVAWLCSKERRCSQKGRGAVYDNIAGITCHFCRQKKLCGEEDCPRCSKRDVEQACIGKSECTRCEAACGRFCRACLLVRYGLQLEAVREQMAAGHWLCPHCYEEDHPDEDWICNSSICMTRRGLKPTGIAIFEAQQQGFTSVAHFVQAQLASRKGRSAAVKKAGTASVAQSAASSKHDKAQTSQDDSETESDDEQTSASRAHHSNRTSTSMLAQQRAGAVSESAEAQKVHGVEANQAAPLQPQAAADSCASSVSTATNADLSGRQQAMASAAVLQGADKADTPATEADGGAKGGEDAAQQDSQKEQPEGKGQSADIKGVPISKHKQSSSEEPVTDVAEPLQSVQPGKECQLRPTKQSV